MVTQVSMLLDPLSYTDTQPFTQTEIEQMLTEINDKLLIDPATARRLAETVAPYARHMVMTKALTWLQ